MAQQSKHALRDLIIDNRIRECTTELLKIANNSNNNRLRDEVITQSSFFNQYQEEVRRNVISTEDASIKLAKIKRSIFELIDQIPDETGPGVLTSASKNKKRIISLLGLLIFLTTAILVINSNFFASLFSGQNRNSTTTELEFWVLLNGSEGANESPLRGEGKLAFQIGNRLEYALIDDKGIAHFKGIPVELEGEMFSLNLEAEGYEPDSRIQQFKLRRDTFSYPVRKLSSKETADNDQEPNSFNDRYSVDNERPVPPPSTPSNRTKEPEFVEDTPATIQPSESTTTLPLKTKFVKCNIGKPNTSIRFEDPFLAQQINAKSDGTGNIEYKISSQLPGTDVKVFYSNPDQAAIPNSNWVEITLKASGCVSIP